MPARVVPTSGTRFPVFEENGSHFVLRACRVDGFTCPAAAELTYLNEDENAFDSSSPHSLTHHNFCLRDPVQLSLIPRPSAKLLAQAHR